MLRFIVSYYLYRQKDLILGMHLFIFLADAAFERVCPSHFEEGCNDSIFISWNIANAIRLLFTFFLVHYRYSIFVIAIVKVALQLQEGSNLQFVPHLVSIMILTASQVAIHEILLSCLHLSLHFKGLTLNSRCKDSARLFQNMEQSERIITFCIVQQRFGAILSFRQPEIAVLLPEAMLHEKIIAF